MAVATQNIQQTLFKKHTVNHDSFSSVVEGICPIMGCWRSPRETKPIGLWIPKQNQHSSSFNRSPETRQAQEVGSWS